MSSAPRMVKDPGHNPGEGVAEAVRILMVGRNSKGKSGKKKCNCYQSGDLTHSNDCPARPRGKKKKPYILVTGIRLVKGNLRKGACRNRNTPTGVMCGSVWRTETRTLKGRLVNVRCLICREVKRVTKLGEKIAQEEQAAKKQSRR